MKNVPLTKKEKFIIVAGIAALIIGYFAYQSFAGANIGISMSNGGGVGNNLSTGLIGWWTFDGNTMNTNVGDSSGRGKNMYMTGWVSTSSATAAGKIGQALYFRKDLLTRAFLPSDSTYDLSGTSFTVAAWVKPEASPPGSFTKFAPIVNKYDGANDTNSWQFRLGGDINKPYYLGLVLGNGSANYYSTQDGGGSNLQTVVASSSLWYHVAATFDDNSNVVKFYVNGVDATGFSQSFAGTVTTNSATVSIGGTTAGSIFPGFIDDVRIYNRAISAAEMKRLYDLGATTHIDVSSQVSGTLPGAPNPNSGLVGHWTFDGVNMTSNVTDSSGRGNTGYLRNYTSTTTVAGKVGQALNFKDSALNAVKVLNNSSLDLTADFTIAMWVKPTAINTGWPEFIQKGTTDTNSWQFRISPLPVNQLELVMGDGSAHYFESTGLTMATSTWSHVAVTYNHTTGAVIFYKDAVSSSGGTFNGTIGTNSNDVNIAGNPSAANTFNGLIDDVRIYNRELSANEMNRLYGMGATTHIGMSLQTSGTTGNSISTGLVGYWTFDGKNMTSNVVDSSGKGNTGYLTNFTSTTTGYGVIGQGLTFNKSKTQYVNVPYNSNFDFGASQDFTISVWVKSTDQGGLNLYPTVVSHEDGLATRQGYSIGLHDSNNNPNWYFSTYQNGTSFATGGLPGSVADGRWHHLVAIRSGSTLSTWQDGQFAGTAAGSSGTLAKNIPFAIGSQSGGCASTCYDGQIDDVRVYNYALSTSTIQRLYQLGK